MKINISEILSNPSVIKNFKVEPDFEKLKSMKQTKEEAVIRYPIRSLFF